MVIGAPRPDRPPLDGLIAAAQIVVSVTLAIVVGAQAIKGTASPDFNMFWAAHHVSAPYDSAILSRALGPKVAFFPYPPTFLLLTLPLAWVSMTVGYFCWLGLSAAALVASLRRMAGPIVLAVPAVFLAGISGQTSLLMGAALYAGAALRSRPILAGVLFGLAACIKPQVMVLLPLALIAAGQWRTLISTAISGLTVFAVATLAYGPGIWADWLTSLPAFLHANDTAWTGRYLALPGLWKGVALVAGAIAVWRAGRYRDLERATLIAVAAALLGSLHAMDYDAAILAPFAVAAALDRRWWGAPYALAIFLPASSLTVLAMAGLAAGDAVLRTRSSPDAATGQGALVEGS